MRSVRNPNAWQPRQRIIYAETISRTFSQAARMRMIQIQLSSLKASEGDETAVGYHLAQFNVARLKAPLDEPESREFALALEPINDLARTSPGFVWMHENSSDEEKNAIPELRVDSLVMPNLSLWEDLGALHHFVFKTGHFMYVKRRKEWFTQVEGYPNAVCWWRPADSNPPSLQEAFERIRLLKKLGNTACAFDFKSAKDYSKPEVTEHSKAQTV